MQTQTTAPPRAVRRRFSSVARTQLARFPALAELSGLEGLLGNVVASWHVSPQVLHSRRWHRCSYREPIVIVPLDDAGQPSGPPLRAAGSDISLAGIGFAHRHPLISTRVAIVLPVPDRWSQAIVTRLVWCRFLQQHIYQSGGMFVGSADLSALAPAAEDDIADA